MRIVQFLALCSVLTLGTPALVLGTPPTPTSADSPFGITLHDGSSFKLKGKDAVALYSKALELVQSSHSNSRTAQGSVRAVQNGYRNTIAGRYLVVGLIPLQVLYTAGGAVNVGEIVIDLNNPHHVTYLFTIDENGRIVEHSEFQGPLCVEITRMVEDISDRVILQKSTLPDGMIVR